MWKSGTRLGVDPVTGWVYEVHLVGELNEEALLRIRGELGDVTARSEPASTQLTVALPDQAALLGVLDRLQALGLTLREVHRMSEPEGGATTRSQTWRPAGRD